MVSGEIIALTFATHKNSFLYKNYSANVKELEASLEKYGIPLIVYNPKKLKMYRDEHKELSPVLGNNALALELVDLFK